MRIDRLQVANFKGFQHRELSFHPQFNLVVGRNGTGKTSILDALSIAVGSWFLGLRGYDSRHIKPVDVNLRSFVTEAMVTWEPQFPCSVEANGVVQGQDLYWKRTLSGRGGRTTYGEARNIKQLAEKVELEVQQSQPIILPLISYYGTGRLWNVPREDAQVNTKPSSKTPRSRLDGYRNSVAPRLSVSEMINWIAGQAWYAFQHNGQKTAAYRAVCDALVRNVHNAKDISFDAKLGEVVVDFADGGRQPFTNLSDGQRCMLAVVGDIAQKAATLNPHLDNQVLLATPGVVLIDELDLHLHPEWQRHVIENLRTTFPQIQFICTTHSPFLIQSLRSGEELVMLEGQPTANLGDLSIEKIAIGIQGVTETAVSARYHEMKSVARNYLETVDRAAEAPTTTIAAYKQQLANNIAPYADNPAFQAFLEMKQTVKLGDE